MDLLGFWRFFCSRIEKKLPTTNLYIFSELIQTYTSIVVSNFFCPSFFRFSSSCAPRRRKNRFYWFFAIAITSRLCIGTRTFSQKKREWKIMLMILDWLCLFTVYVHAGEVVNSVLCVAFLLSTFPYVNFLARTSPRGTQGLTQEFFSRSRWWNYIQSYRRLCAVHYTMYDP